MSEKGMHSVRFEKEPNSERPKARLEKQPIENWRIERDTHYVEVVHIDKNGERHTTSDIYKRETYSSTIETLLDPGDVKLEITPHRMQLFTVKVHLPFEDGSFVTKLAVDLEDQNLVRSVTIFWKDTNKEKKFSQFLFSRDGNPSACIQTDLFSWSWPTKNPEVITDEMREYFADLIISDFNLQAGHSLANAIDILSKPAR